MSLLLGGLAVIGWSLLGKPLSAPDWMRAEIEARLAQQLPGYELQFSDMTLFVQRDLRPEISLSNVELREAASGRVLLTLSQAEITIARRTLLEGQVQPRTISVAGVFLQLHRNAQGDFDIAFGGGLGASGIGLNGLISRIDDFIYQPRFAALQEVDISAVTLGYQDARAGRTWTVDGGRLNLTREGDLLQMRGDFALLSGRSYAATLELFGESTIGSNAVSLGLSVDEVSSGDIASQSAALAWLGVLRAPISGSLRTSFNEDGKLGLLNATLRIGEGVLQPSDATRPIPFSEARTYFSYEPRDNLLRFGEFAVASDWGSATGEATAILEEGARGLPKGLQGQVKLAGISANPNAIFDAPRSLTSADLDFHLALDPFALRIGRLALVDEGTRMRLNGRVSAAPEGWDISLMGGIDEIGPERILSFWPADIKTKTRTWIADNVLAGSLRNIAVSLQARPDGSKPEVYFSAEVADASVRFMRNMPPVTGAAGLVQIEDNRLVVSVDRGTVTAEEGGALEAAGTVFTIPDLAVKPAPAHVALNATGPIPAALWLLNREPLSALDKAGRGIDIADGALRVTGDINFPLKPKPAPTEVLWAVEGQGFDVRSTSLVPNKVLAAETLRFAAENASLRIEGQGTLEGVAFDGFWQTPLGPGALEQGARVEADVALSNAFLDAFSIELPPGTVSGRGTGRLEMDLKRGVAPSFSLSSNLAGLGLRLEAIGWSMGREATGQLQIDGTLSTPARIDRLSLSAPGLSLAGRLDLSPGGGLRALTLDRLRAGSWLDAPVLLTGRGKGVPPAVTIAGGRIDMRAAPFATTGGGARGGAARASGPLTLAPDRLQITDGIVLTGFRGQFSTQGGLGGAFQAKLNGGTPLRGSVTPTERGQRFVVKADDAGGVLRDAGLLKNVHGGSFHLKLVPTGAPGTFDGELDIVSTRIRNAPVMAELLSAISVIGLLEQLGGQGISFQEVEARFRLTPRQVILTRSSAVGPSMGITLDGYYDLASKTMDMQGVLSPIYVVNFVGQLFSRKGEGLFGFNFTLKGRSDNPRISVNPLSALTPGMFREIFRRPPPTVQR
ncbi:MAG: hypothetical protein EP318_16690 [Rhodobacteraceae bacterium]|nr:MAG: hypothetical protein EP318_16690 [Paracoccaceae bacterium]